MWNKSAMVLMVRVKVQRRRGFTFSVPVWVVDEFIEALTDLAWVGELALKHVPVPRDEKASKHLCWVKGIPLRGIIAASHDMFKDLYRYKGLDVVDVATGDIQVKISLK
ncbi:MAG: hypothetical protein P4L49_01280 [Desulfosporosinus sp.]|nr:hypothetical protein [Desulfosporosinus sp.]